MRKAKLWKITDSLGGVARPESKVKVYDLYLPVAAANYRSYVEGNGPESELARQRQHVTVWLDERDGQGWQRYEDIDLATWGAS